MDELIKILETKFELRTVKKGEFKGQLTFTTSRGDKYFLSETNGCYCLFWDGEYDTASICETSDLKIAKRKVKKFVDHDGLWKECHTDDDGNDVIEYF